MRQTLYSHIVYVSFLTQSHCYENTIILYAGVRTSLVCFKSIEPYSKPNKSASRSLIKTSIMLNQVRLDWFARCNLKFIQILIQSAPIIINESYRTKVSHTFTINQFPGHFTSVLSYQCYHTQKLGIAVDNYPSHQGKGSACVALFIDDRVG